MFQRLEGYSAHVPGGLLYKNLPRVGSPPIRTYLWWVIGLGLVVNVTVLLHSLSLMLAESTLTYSLPLDAKGSLIMFAAPRSQDAESEASGQVIRELRLRVGREDRLHDDYIQLLDLTVPL
jgi:hypothetical protein